MLEIIAKKMKAKQGKSKPLCSAPKRSKVGCIQEVYNHKNVKINRNQLIY